MAARLGEVIAAQPLPECVDRITTTVAGGGGAVMHHHFTFRRGAAGAVLAGFGEDRLIRGLHPRVAERMQLERLREFDLTRLPSADEEVYLFRCVAQANPADERLVAMAQVRDLTPLREADGRLASLPAAEDALAACLDAIRIVQAQRPARQALRHQPDRHLRLAAERPDHGRPDHGRAGPDRPARAADHGGRGPGGGPLPGPAAQPGDRRAVGPGRDDPRRRRLRRPPLGGPAVGRAGAAAGRLPAEGAARGAPRHRLPLRAHRDAGRRGLASPSTTSTTPARWCRWTGRGAGTRPRSSPGS